MPTPEQDFDRFRRAADAAALAAVFDAVAPELLLVAAHLLPQPGDAEDLVQATFVSAIELRDRWDRNRPLMPWLLGVLTNHARELRRRRARAPDPRRLVGGTAPSALDEAAAAEIAERIAAAVRGLPRPYRQVLTLRLVHGLSPTAIAHALGCPIDTAKTRLQRGLDHLRKALPPGIAATLALGLTAGPGLAAARAVALARAAEIAVPVAAGAMTASTLTLWGLTMKKLLLAAAAAVLVGVCWTALAAPVAVDAPDLVAGVGAPAVAAVTAAPTPAPEIAPVAADRVAVASSAAPTAATGSVDLQFVWQGRDRPAAQLRVWVKGEHGAELRWRTDGDGRVRCGPVPVGPWFAYGRALWAPFTVRAGEVTTATIEVPAGVEFTGVVVDGTGRPVADATVQVQYFADRSDDRPRPAARSAADGTFTAITDFGGAVWAERAGMVASATVDVGTDGADAGGPLRLVLGDRAATVRGVVRGDRDAVADARIVVVRVEPENTLSAPVVLHTDTDGRFATDALATGHHRLVVFAAGWSPTRHDFEVHAGRDEMLEVVLRRGAAIAARIRDTDGAELASALEVRPEWAGGGDRFANALRPLYHDCAVRVASPTGDLRLDRVPVGRVAIEAMADPGPRQQQRSLVLVDGEVARCDFAFAPAATAAVRGVAVDSADAPLAGWRVVADPDGGGFVLTAVVGADGAFAFEGAAAKGYTVRLLPPREDRHLPWLVRRGELPRTGELRLRLPCRCDDGAAITGRVRSDDPKATAQLMLTPAGSAMTGMLELQLGPDGAFAAADVPPGTYRGALRLPNHGSLALGDLALAPRATLDLGEVRLAAPGTIELQLRHADGRAAEPIDLVAYDRAGNHTSFAVGDDQVHRSQPLPAGTYRVRAWGVDFVRLDGEVTVVPGRASASTLVVRDAPPVVVSCRLDDGDGDRQVQLSLRTTAGAFVCRATLIADDGGGAEWRRGLPPGDYVGEATVADGSTAPISFTVPATDTDPVRVDVRLSRVR